MVRNLQYLETPQYLRKSLFEMHSDLKNAGIMNPIECDHHLKVEEVGEFREGVVLARPVKDGKGSWVDIGLRREAQMDLRLEPKTRVTLRVGNY
jgi:predicted SPOUT superfamily RNA methylase MTH1